MHASSNAPTASSVDQVTITMPRASAERFASAMSLLTSFPSSNQTVRPTHREVELVANVGTEMASALQLSSPRPLAYGESVSVTVQADDIVSGAVITVEEIATNDSALADGRYHALERNGVWEVFDQYHLRTLMVCTDDDFSGDGEARANMVCASLNALNPTYELGTPVEF